MTDIPVLTDLDRTRLGNAEFLRRGIDRLGHGLMFDDPPNVTTMLVLLRRLHAAGRHDLALGRLFEGHVDALQIIARYAAPDVCARAHAAATTGATFGVWNAAWLECPLICDGRRLSGGKSFTSGAGVISHALVSVNAGDRNHVELRLVDLVCTPPCIDTGWWRTLGMQASETHRVFWYDLPLANTISVGAPGDYERLPWFATGALRFVAVQAGGIAALFDEVRAHLCRLGRDGDPHQRRRLARLFGLAQGAAAICRDSASAQFVGEQGERIAHVAHARSAVADMAEEAITLTQQSIGVGALFETHPAARVLADLMVYLRQPGPDAQRMAVAEAAAAGELKVRL